MNLSAEISMYPLKDEYIPSIKAFIDRLKKQPNLKVISNTMSTQVFGEFDVVMDTLREEIRNAYQQHGRAIFVCKFIEGDLSP
jgi:uncharacterized protein YqgV (UPF0045/DUF77 family)